MHLQESGEMYLETILILTNRLSVVRSIDVCEYMGFSKPSVSRAIGLLKKGEYVEVDAKGHLKLTPSGHDVAQKIYERHRVLTSVLVSIGVDPKNAADDACKMEHDISDETFEAIKRYLKKTEQNS